MTRASTCHNSIDNRIKSTKALVGEILNQFNSLDSKYDQLCKEFSKRSDSTLHSLVNDDIGDLPLDFLIPGPMRPPLMKIEFPQFCDGDGPLGWIYKREHYLDYFAVSNKWKVCMASFHMENEELKWFRWLDCVHTYPNWEEFTRGN
ncbi:unnamed protein product [Prunus armeniaca]|uniref:Uncharacterized protein n=1 Tax=Prunus armeniaca TaxID=36596 RepID=A0A6J5VX78_PRUAR|nr:unnamed protein product [Prunus armeniaca]